MDTPAVSLYLMGIAEISLEFMQELLRAVALRIPSAIVDAVTAGLDLDYALVLWDDFHLTCLSSTAALLPDSTIFLWSPLDFDAAFPATRIILWWLTPEWLLFSSGSSCIE